RRPPHRRDERAARACRGRTAHSRHCGAEPARRAVALAAERGTTPAPPARPSAPSPFSSPGIEASWYRLPRWLTRLSLRPRPSGPTLPSADFFTHARPHEPSLAVCPTAPLPPLYQPSQHDDRVYRSINVTAAD